MSAQEDLVHWLKDAYAMEQGVVNSLDAYAKDSGEHPELQSRMRQHVEETHRHAERIESCLERLGESPSVMKNVVGKMSGFFQGVGTGPAKDEVIKNLLSSYAAENFEIASYRSLVAGAEAIGDSETARVCSAILEEEEEMARFIEEQIPVMTQRYLSMQLGEGGSGGVGLGRKGEGGTMRDASSGGGSVRGTLGDAGI